jgi:hypothetical protein
MITIIAKIQYLNHDGSLVWWIAFPITLILACIYGAIRSTYDEKNKNTIDNLTFEERKQKRIKEIIEERKEIKNKSVNYKQPENYQILIQSLGEFIGKIPFYIYIFIFSFIILIIAYSVIFS